MRPESLFLIEDPFAPAEGNLPIAPNHFSQPFEGPHDIKSLRRWHLDGGGSELIGQVEVQIPLGPDSKQPLGILWVKYTPPNPSRGSRVVGARLDQKDLQLSREEEVILGNLCWVYDQQTKNSQEGTIPLPREKIQKMIPPLVRGEAAGFDPAVVSLNGKLPGDGYIWTDEMEHVFFSPRGSRRFSKRNASSSPPNERMIEVVTPTATLMNGETILPYVRVRENIVVLSDADVAFIHSFPKDRLLSSREIKKILYPGRSQLISAAKSYLNSLNQKLGGVFFIVGRDDCRFNWSGDENRTNFFEEQIEPARFNIRRGSKSVAYGQRAVERPDQLAGPDLTSELVGSKEQEVEIPKVTLTNVGNYSLHHESSRLIIYQEKGLTTTIDLTPTEFKILELLMRNPGNILLKSKMIHEIWPGEEVDGATEKNLRVRIHEIRDKLKSHGGNPGVVEAVHAMGYLFKDVEKDTEVGKYSLPAEKGKLRVKIGITLTEFTDISLSAHELGFLRILFSKTDLICNQTNLVKELSKMGIEVSNKGIRHIVFRIRRKFKEKNLDPEALETISRGVYRFNPEK